MNTEGIDTDVPEKTSLEDLKAAFERAAALRDKPFGVYRIKPKDGKRVVHPQVLVTNQREGKYVLVLIPYNEAELRNARDKFIVTEQHPKPHMRKGIHIPVQMHEQWVHEDRLQKVA